MCSLHVSTFWASISAAASKYFYYMLLGMTVHFVYLKFPALLDQGGVHWMLKGTRYTVQSILYIKHLSGGSPIKDN